MKNTPLIDIFVQLGEDIKALSPEELFDLSQRSALENPWFTMPNIQYALTGLTTFLDRDKLVRWMDNYTPTTQPRNVGIVMAGNIPSVGFHDMLCVLLSGHNAILKPSTKDTVLIKFLIRQMQRHAGNYPLNVSFSEKLNDVDAIIATGSDNSARYFHQYFSKIPHIIRKNRTSVGILSGKESSDDFSNLGKDIFTYFGLGCRSISKLLVPHNYDFNDFFKGIESYSNVLQHHKYHNNYDYNKSILLVNGVKHLDNGFLLVRQTEELVSPISVLFYDTYKNQENLDKMIHHSKNKIQCIVSNGGWYDTSLAFGQTQMPEPWNYADDVDTMAFLCGLE